MKKILSDIDNGQEDAKRIKELYELLSTYNAYNILLLKAKKEYERENITIEKYYQHSDCYKKQIENVFELFKNDECLRLKQLSGINDEDMLFLIDNNTLLRIHSFDIMNSHIGGLSQINYEFLNINNCIAKVYNQSEYYSDPYYYDYYYENKKAFGLFYFQKLITPSYVLDNQFREYNNKDIREILKIQSLDEIHEKIEESKNIKVKKLSL